MGDDEKLLWGVVHNANRFRKRGWSKSPLWSIVSEMTGCGSTTAIQTCKRFGLDPHSISNKNVPLPEPPAKVEEGKKVDG